MFSLTPAGAGGRVDGPAGGAALEAAGDLIGRVYHRTLGDRDAASPAVAAAQQRCYASRSSGCHQRVLLQDEDKDEEDEEEEDEDEDDEDDDDDEDE